MPGTRGGRGNFILFGKSHKAVNNHMCLMSPLGLGPISAPLALARPLLAALGCAGDAVHVHGVARTRGCGGVCTRALWSRMSCRSLLGP